MKTFNRNGSVPACGNPSPEAAQGFKRKLGQDIEKEIKLQKFEDSKYARAVL
jgi:hypothetical protein